MQAYVIHLQNQDDDADCEGVLCSMFLTTAQIKLIFSKSQIQVLLIVLQK